MVVRPYLTFVEKYKAIKKHLRLKEENSEALEGSTFVGQICLGFVPPKDKLGITASYGSRVEELFDLDEEDLDYLYTKYAYKLEEERDEQIEKVQSDYDKISDL